MRFLYAPVSWQRGLIVSGIGIILWLGLIGSSLAVRIVRGAR
ncbi:MAG: hypothetical protein R3E79_58895 [Caldilineaceae bacterium]